MKQQEHQYIQSGLLPMPKPKPHLGSFRKYYTRSLQIPSKFNHSPQAKPKAMIDDFLIQKIQKLAPSKIGKEFKKRKSLNQKIKTDKNEIGEFSMAKHQLMIEKFRNRSLELSKQAALAEYRVKKQVKKHMKRINPFDASDIAWAQQRWGSKQKYQKLGKYSQKLHPICLIYEQTAEKVEHFGKQGINPFEGYNHLQFS